MEYERKELVEFPGYAIDTEGNVWSCMKRDKKKGNSWSCQKTGTWKKLATAIRGRRLMYSHFKWSAYKIHKFFEAWKVGYNAIHRVIIYRTWKNI